MDENINFGDSVQLSCHVSKGDRPFKISWSFDGDETLKQLGVTTTKMGDRTSFLTIPSVVAAHNGNYSCTASNAAGSTSHTATIRVNGIFFFILYYFFIFNIISVLPQIRPFSFGDGPINAGDIIIANCVVMRGDPPLEIMWRYSGDVLKSPNVVISKYERLSSLTIPSVTSHHSGAYTCIVRNRAGQTNHTAFLHVNGS